jgi:hypothetical protein
MNVKLCRECRHSMPEPGSEWNLRCMNAEVNKRDAWALEDQRRTAVVRGMNEKRSGSGRAG